jgi:hypothetical protein
MIIGITGLIASGKDTMANYLTTFYGFKKVSFAANLKDAIAVIFNWDRELLEGSTKTSREWRERIDPWWAARLNIPNLTPRWILQYWGTEVCRRNFHDDIWVASLENKLLRTSEDIVITDCRFPNELTAIRNIGGITVRVLRGPNPNWYDDAIELTNNPQHHHLRIKLEELGIHASEYSSVGLEYDHYITNDSTIDDLHTKLQDIVNNQPQDHRAPI